MAVDSSPEGFERQMRALAKEVEENTSRIVRGGALVCYQVLVTSTPFDTGRARGSWLATIGAPVFRVMEGPTGTRISSAEAAAISSAVLSQGNAVIGRWKVGRGSIFLSNGVAYIDELDNGSSRQAPEGMTRKAVLIANAYMATQKLLR